jgi:hypothetical protein
MKKPPAEKPKPKQKTFAKPPKIELEQGAWQKFEALIKRAAKMGHKPHAAPKKSKAAR